MSGLHAALLRVVEILEQEGLSYMVIGGMANLVWGEERVTTDLDLTVDVEAIGAEGFLHVATRCGRPLVEDPAAFAERSRVLPVRDPEGVRVDFLIATLPFEFEALSRSRRVRLDEVEFPVCGPEDLILYKAASERARDHEDIVGILRRQRERLDLARLDHVVEGLASDLGEPEIAERWRAAKRVARLA